MKKIRNLKKTKKKKENYYENNNLKKNKKKNKIEKRAFTMYWRKFSSDPYSHHTLLLPRLVKTDFNQFNQAVSSISRPTNN